LKETIDKMQLPEDDFATKLAPREDRSTKILTTGDKIFLKDGEKCWFIDINEIRMFESYGNYVKVYFQKFRPMILRSLNSLEERLDPQVFFRANRKFIINLNWVSGIENWFNGGLQVQLKENEKVEVSRRQAIKFKEIMSL
jgi:two-component system LytT family response regulator